MPESGSIRRQLGPTKKRLLDYFDTAKSVVAASLSSKDVELSLHSLRVCLNKGKNIFGQYSKLRSEQAAIAKNDPVEEARLEKEDELEQEIVLDYQDIAAEVTAAIESISERIKRADENLLMEKKNKEEIELRKNLITVQGAIGASTSAAVLDTSSSRQHFVKLPELKLVKFDGDLLRWSEFWDSFESNIHDNDSLNNVDKFAYLRSQLLGEAQEVIAGLMINNDNYNTAVQLLKERYGNNDLIVEAHYRLLQELPSANKTTASQRSTQLLIEKHLRTLKALGEDDNQPLFVQIIKNKFPIEFLAKLEEKKIGPRWTTTNLRVAIRQLITAKESYERVSEQKPNSNDQKWSAMDKPKTTWMSTSSFRQPTKRYTNEAVLVNSAAKTDKSQSTQCVYCNGNHWSDTCKQFFFIDERLNKLKNLCTICLSTKHTTNNCNSERRCFYCQQLKQHHRSLCPQKFKFSKNNSISVVAVNENSGMTKGLEKQVVNAIASSINESSLNCNSKISGVLLQTAVAKVFNTYKTKYTQVRVVFDSGSQRSYITQNLINVLEIREQKLKQLQVFTFGSDEPIKVDSKEVSVEIELNDKSTIKLTVSSVPFITRYSPPVNIDLANYGLHNFCLSDSPNNNFSDKIDLLIGLDYYASFFTTERININDSLCLYGSRLGWILAGGISSDETTDSSLTMLTTFVNFPLETGYTTIDKSLSQNLDLKQYWDLESLGIREPIKENEDDVAVQQFNDSVKFYDGRYYIKWPWKTLNTDIPTNFALAQGRLKSLVKRLNQDKAILINYNQVIQEQLKLNIIERVDFKPNVQNKVHYLPHHAVFKQNSTTNLRIVFDGSAKSKRSDLSVNECLLKGPVFLEDIFKILIRFRFNRIAFVTDIEKAFLQIGVQESDRDITRFLWLKDIRQPVTDNNIQEFRFCRLPFGMISSPFLLASVIRYHLKNTGLDNSSKILENMYVDNLIMGTESNEEALTFYNNIKEVFLNASFNLREWASNSVEFLNNIPLKDRSAKIEQKVLGLNWCTKNDTFKFSVKFQSTFSLVTKRTVLAAVSEIFDPLGLLCPCLVPAKLFLRSLWSANLDWDTPLNSNQVELWLTLYKGFKNIENFSLNRFININFSSCVNITYDLHVFCDASKDAYGASVYIACSNNQLIDCHLLFSKSKLAPLKEATIARLELLGVLIGSRCLNYVLISLCVPIRNQYLWSDSVSVLCWLTSNKTLPIFIDRRVKEIKQNEGVIFRFVPGTENPADILSRGTTFDQLISYKPWWNGPQWLKDPQQRWPPPPNSLASAVASANAEDDNQNVIFYSTLTTKNLVVESVIPFQNFSSLIRLIRVMAYILRFISCLKARNKNISNLSNFELEKAKIALVRLTQVKYFPELFEAIKNKKYNDYVYQYNLFINQNGLLCCQSRLENAKLPIETVCPVLLPKDANLTVLIIKNIHETNHHVGVSQTLALIRSNFWIANGRRTVQKVLKGCLWCNRLNCGPYKIPPLPPLPVERVSQLPPFSYTGIDYCGPFFVFENNKTKKVWVCLFVCLSIRALRIEIVEDLTAHSFLLALRRFIAKNGSPISIFSDNATTFKASDKALQSLCKRNFVSEEVKNFSNKNYINWKFVIEYAPWMAGFYERFVGLVKVSLVKVVGRTQLTTIEFNTVLYEIEFVINSRPLTKISTDVNECVLTPNHFLNLYIRKPFFINEIFDENNKEFFTKISTVSTLIERWELTQGNVLKFWKVWQSDYLTSLLERKQTNLKQPHIKNHLIPKVGELVLIKNNSSKINWITGIIDELHSSKDGFFRSATVRIPPNNKKLKRALALLYPLEL